MNVPLTAGAGSLRPGTSSSETVRFPVSGMTCGSCVNRITRALKRLEGVHRVRVDLGRELVAVRRDLTRASDTALAAAIATAGYEAHLEQAVNLPEAGPRGWLAGLFRR